MNAEEIREMLEAVCDKLIDSEQLLCELDSGVGDGDHGITVARGFQAVRQKLAEETVSYPTEILSLTGHTLSVTMGGAIGPILGSFFQAGARKMEDMQKAGQESRLTKFQLPEFELMFREGLKKIELLGGAGPGDRTLVDALEPASRALTEAMAENKSLQQAFTEAKAAAAEGAENTKHMKARKGRAKFLGEQSVGHVDAGATTMAIIVATMCDFMNR